MKRYCFTTVKMRLVLGSSINGNARILSFELFRISQSDSLKPPLYSSSLCANKHPYLQASDDAMIRQVGLCEGMINFTNRFSNQRCEALETKHTRQVISLYFSIHRFFLGTCYFALTWCTLHSIYYLYFTIIQYDNIPGVFWTRARFLDGSNSWNSWERL